MQCGSCSWMFPANFEDRCRRLDRFRWVACIGAFAGTLAWVRGERSLICDRAFQNWARQLIISQPTSSGPLRLAPFYRSYRAWLLKLKSSSSLFSGWDQLLLLFGACLTYGFWLSSLSPGLKVQAHSSFMLLLLSLQTCQFFAISCPIQAS